MIPQQNAYGNELIARLRNYYGKNVVRIVCFSYSIREIQIIIKPEHNLKVMRDELLNVIDSLLPINYGAVECFKIYFCYGFTAEKEFFFVNVNEDALRWLGYRNLDPKDYVSVKEYQELKRQGVISL
jgi:hypothetical protein